MLGDIMCHREENNVLTDSGLQILFDKNCSPQRKNREWSDKDMFHLMELINAGHSYQTVTDGMQIPISTLWMRHVE